MNAIVTYKVLEHVVLSDIAFEESAVNVSLSMVY